MGAELDVSSVPELAEQGRVLTERMRALGAGSLSIRASTATLGPRIFREFEAEVEPLGDRSQVLDARFLDEDGNHVHAVTRFDETGETLQSGQVEIILSDRPRAAERALSRFAPAALEYDLLARALDTLALDRLVLLRPTADRPWELSLISAGQRPVGDHARCRRQSDLVLYRRPCCRSVQGSGPAQQPCSTRLLRRR